MVGRIITNTVAELFRIGKRKRQLLEGWVNSPATIQVQGEKIDGRIKYGVRVPMASAYRPLLECKPGSRKPVNGESPLYWFVSDDETVKVRMPLFGINYVNDKNIKGNLIRPWCEYEILRR